MTEDPLLRFRPEFPTLDRATDLISNSLGAMPTAAPEGLSEEIKDILATGAWQRFADRRTAVS